MKKNRLTPRELEVMEILWKHDEPLPACDIQKDIPELSVNSVLPILKRLLNKEYIHIADYSQRNTDGLPKLIISVSEHVCNHPFILRHPFMPQLSLPLHSPALPARRFSIYPIYRTEFSSRRRAFFKCRETVGSVIPNSLAIRI